MRGEAVCGEAERGRWPTRGYNGHMAGARRGGARRGGARTKAHERLRCEYLSYRSDYHSGDSSCVGLGCSGNS